jgi:hypothetical protein
MTATTTAPLFSPAGKWPDEGDLFFLFSSIARRVFSPVSHQVPV